MALPLLIHGDAAFAGRGVVAECFGLSELKGYRTGGSLHFIVSNQIGFTTYPRYSRSSPYPSDVAKMIEALIFHVNGDDPEAVVFAAKVAIEYRQRFAKPVVIDMFCYRRFGHNEGDEPAFTQPLMYQKIRVASVDAGHLRKKLIAEDVVTEGEVDKMKADWRARLEAEFEASQGYKPNKADWLDGRWSGMKPGIDVEDPRRGNTGVDDRQAERDRQENHEGATRNSRSIAPSAASSTIAARRSKPARASTGRLAKPWRSARCWKNAIMPPLRTGFGRGTFSQRHSVLFDQPHRRALRAVQSF